MLRLSARARPRVVEFTKTIVPPAYSGWKETQVTADQGDLEALDGSTIKLTLKTNQPVAQSDFVLNPDLPEKKTLPSTTTPEGLLSTEIAVQPTHVSWQIALKSQETGFTNEESTPWRITTIPDLPPIAQISEPSEQIELLPSLDGHGVDIVFRRTSELTMREMSELIEYIRCWAAENEVEHAA